MEFNPKITIKREEDCYESKNENDLELDFDSDIKVENTDICEDWLIENVLEDCQDVVSFDVLKKESLQTCFICCQFFTNIYSLIQHNLTHLRVPLIKRKFYICHKCPNFYKNKEDLKTHMYSHFSKKLLMTKCKTYTCKICQKTLKYKNWGQHMNSVHGQEELHCSECNKIFKCQQYLNRHVKYVHGNSRPAWRFRSVKLEEIDCPICKKIFMNKHALKAHIRNCHTNGIRSQSTSPAQCNIFKSVLKCESYLKVHHDDGKVYTCHCGKYFRSPPHLRIHQKNSHNSEAKLAQAL